jgi:hypothetical protein
MSPNEFQLRAALRDGEGEHLDPEAVISRARAVTQARRDRRVRYLSVAAVVAVVGGIGTAAGITLSGGGGNSSSANMRMSTANGGGAAQSNAAKPPAAAGPSGRAAAIACPGEAPVLRIPAGGSSGQFGAGRSLFSGPVEAIKLCAYDQQTRTPIPDQGGQTISTVLTGAPATALAASLDAAPKTRPHTPCPLYLSANGKTLVIIGLSTSGQAMPPITAVVAQNACGLPVTNGTAMRWSWSAPGVLTSFIARLAPAHGGGAISVHPSGKVTGSPVRS